jgi:hypothetical protein
MRRALLTMVQSVRIHMWRLRGQAALAVAANKKEGWRARLAEATGAARRIEREGAPWGDPFIRMLRAGVVTVEGDAARAAVLYDDAARSADDVHMSFVATVARRSRGLQMGGGEGRSLVEAADAWMRARSVKSPERMAATVAPWISWPGG